MGSRKLRILFVEPKSAYEGFSFGWLNKLPTIGVVYLATILKNKGHKVAIYKESIKKIKIAELTDIDVLCISIMTPTAKRGYEIAKLFKSLNKKGRVIIGGIHASVMPEEAVKYADYVITKEAENILPQIIENGINEKIIHGEKIEDLDSLDFPDYKLIKNIKRIPILSISTSRGCPYNCSFCSVSKVFGRNPRYRSVENVIEELKFRYKQGYRNFLFYDDNFTFNLDRVKGILEGILRNDLRIQWSAQTRVEVAKDKELLNLIKKSGGNYLCIGFESINPATLAVYNKHQDLEDIKECISLLHECKIKIHGMFVLGSDADDEKVITATYDFCKSTNIESPQFSILTPFPGTKIYQDLKNQNRIFTTDWNLYDGHHVVFLPKQINAYTLQKLTMEAVAKFYWFTKRGLKFFLLNLDSAWSMIRNIKKWSDDNKKYLQWLRKKLLLHG
jgi:radical SAM superfamily enzyme YgiQ (UPF0313 family)